MPRPSAAIFPERAALLAAVQRILAQYEDTAVTVRQLYYRLVAGGIIPNNLRSYKNLVAALSKWRRSREVPIEAFEDRTRGMNRLDKGQRHDDPAGWALAYLRAGVREAKNYRLAKWYGQEYRVIVAVEKQALEGPFTTVCEEMHVDLAVCRGYPSISFLAEIAGALDDSDANRNDRKNVVLYFGDFDPSGQDIPKVVERDLGDGFFGQDLELKFIALNREQIDDLDLVSAPAKLGDSRAESFIAEHGEEVYELDAIEPAQLQQMIRDAVGEYFDDDTDGDRDDLVQKGRKKIAGILERGGVMKLMKKLEAQAKASGDTDAGDEAEDDGGEE